MSSTLHTLLDIVKANGHDPLVGLIDETTKATPEINIVPSRVIRGINYKTLVRTALGNSTGSFRDVNEGVDPHKHTYENRLVETYTLESRWHADRAAADRYEDGAAAYIAMQASGSLLGEMQGLGRQFFYGTTASGNAKGFPGLIQSYAASTMEVDAGGTTANTGSSAWLVKFGPMGVQWVWGNNGQMNLSDVRIESILASNNKYLDAYVQTLLAYPGLAVHSTQAVCRIRDLTADSGRGLTDSLLADALAKFPVGIRPDAIFVSRRSLSQLRKSRTVVLNGGPGNARLGGAVENIVTGSLSYDGIPIVETDSILDTEALS